ncbi:MAG: zinc metallopeptidase [Lachnospiraceae bacterium]|nr:zinc metallopeptidase [Lachnospiraceae bacterium]
MFLYNTDIYYLILVVPALIIAMIAQVKVQSTFTKYSKEISYRGETAEALTRKILDANGLDYIRIERVAGDLTDHYDPKNNVIRLSDTVYGSSSIAAIGVAAHEAGHAVQRKENYAPIRVRNYMLPLTQFASYAAIPLAMLGLIFGNILLPVGVILFAVTVLFQIVTLPVEFDASKRALNTLRDEYYLDENELQGAKKVLIAAAMTYVASAFVAIMNLLRLILIANRNRRD